MSLRYALFLTIAFAAAPRAQGAIHAWEIREIFTNDTGSLQFIEMFTNSNGQNISTGAQITVDDGMGSPNTFTLPGPNLPFATGGHRLLFGTAGLQAAGGPAPDYIIPNGFLFIDGATISFFGSNSGPYDALLTNGQARDFTNGQDFISNTPTNFAGASGFVAVSEPGAVPFAAAGLYGLFALRRRLRLV